MTERGDRQASCTWKKVHHEYRGRWACGGGGGAPMNIDARESPTRSRAVGPCAAARKPSMILFS